VGLIWALFANDTHDFNAISGNFSKNFTPLFSSREIGGSLDLQGTTGLRKIFLEANKNSFIRIRNEQVEGSSPLASSIVKSRLPKVFRESFSLHETRILGLIWALSAEISMPLVKSREC